MLLSIGIWWSSIELLEKMYWAFAIPFSIVFVIQLIRTLIGSGTDPEIENTDDLDTDNDIGIGFQFLTLKNFVAFFAVFGWTGVKCLDYELSSGLSLFISIIGGMLMMFVMSGFYYLLGRLTKTGKIKMDLAIGKTATVYLRIPANKEGTGKVQVNIQGLKTVDAVTKNPEDLKSGSLVKIVGLESDEVLLVELL
jgi:hypothetical protein